MTAQDKPPVVIDPPHVPDVFASFVHGVSRREGNIHITLASDRFNHTTNEATLVVIGRLVMPIAGAQNMALLLYNFLKDIGLDPMPAPPKDKMQ